MVWTAPMTAVDNDVFTAAQFNAHIRDNLLETMPGKATTVGSYFVSVDANIIAERFTHHDYVATEESTTSSAFVDLATFGPSITFTTGSSFLIFMSTQITHSSTTGNSHMGFDISGDITQVPSAILTVGGASGSNPRQMGMIFRAPIVPPESEVTVTAQYRTNTGTATFSQRRLGIINF